MAVPATQIEREANAQLIGFIEERLGALDDIRANGAGEYVLRRLILSQREWYHANMKAWFLRTGIWISMMLMTMAGHILVLALGVGLYQAGVVTLGTVYLFFNYMTMLEDPLDEFSRQMQEFQRAGAGFRRVRELLAEKSQIVDGALAGHGDAVRNVPASGDDAGHARSYDSDSAGGRRGGLGTSAHDVAFQSVTFSYVDTPEDKGETDVHHGVFARRLL